MPTARFRHPTTAPIRPAIRTQGRQTDALSPQLEQEPLTPFPLPPGYSEALTAAQRYSRSYTRLSRSMQQTYGSIPRTIPPQYLRRMPTARHIDPEPLPIEEESTTEQAPDMQPKRSMGKILILVLCLLLVLIVIGSWGGALFVSSTLSSTSAPDPGYSVQGAPSISASFIDQVLTYYHSPAAGQGQALYELGVTYGIDPAFALAFFQNESTFGTQGMATITHGLGNERCVDTLPCVNTWGGLCQAGQSCYAQFASWRDGFEGWYRLIHDGYVGASGTQFLVSSRCPCRTIEKIIPVYAPNSDHNNEAHYIRFVEHAVDTWRAGKVVVG